MKAIITDLDRTLLRTDKSISKRTVSALCACRKQGMRIIAASARPLRDIKKYDEIIGFDAIIASNGAVTVLPCGISEAGIDPKSGEKVLEKLLMFPDITLSVETSSGLYANRDIPGWHPALFDQFPKLPKDVTLYKILASSEDPALYANIHSFLTDDVYCTIAKQTLLQIMSSNATKYSGIQKVLDHFDISPKDAVYFGDDYDDIEPFRNCGLGIAVSNAIDAAKDAADRITQSNDQEGVAVFIEQYILKEG